ncbi:MAG: hypothetical protein LBG52_07725 [Candidatus Peribacteria bacterium]|jgi:hypothetical protein|nr:hypothetical protein [Candidatus Peribacteria bacterium]
MYFTSYVYTMKKLLICLSILALGVVAVTSAQAVLPANGICSYPISGYAGNNQLAFEAIDDTQITFTSPIIRDECLEIVKDFRIFYSTSLIDPSRIAEMFTSQDYQQIRLTSAQMTSTTGFQLSLGIANGLSPDVSYYAVVVPLTDYFGPTYEESPNEAGIPSQQFCFNLSEARIASGTACATFDTLRITPEEPLYAPQSTDTHGAAGTNRTLANVSHTVTGNTITLRWTAIEGGGEADLLLFNLQQEKFIRIATVRMSDERYDYTMTWDGQHLFRFRPLDGGTEIRYAVQAMKVSGTTPPTTGKIEEVPKTGPVEDFLGMLIIALLIYGGYKVYHRKNV